MKKIISSLILFAVVGLAQAQTLEALINTALEKNYGIKIYHNEAIIAEHNNTAGNAGQLPTVGFEGTASTALNNTRQQLADGSIREGTNASSSNINFALMANWGLFQGFKVYAKRDQLGYLDDVGTVNAKFYIEQTVADIAMAYYQLKFQFGVLQNYQQALKVSKFRYELEEKRKAVGAGTGLSYQQALVDFQTDSMLVLEQLSILKSLQIDINKLLIDDPENEVHIKDTSFVLMALSPKDSLLNIVATENKILQQTQLEELIAETEIRIQKAEKYPQINLFAGVEYSKSFSEVGFINSNRNLGPVAGVNISFNLFNGGYVNRAIKNAKITFENAALNTKKVEQELNADIIKLYYQYDYLLQRLNIAQSNLKAAQKVLLIAQQQFDNGKINGYDFRNSQLSQLKSSMDVIQLQFTLKGTEIAIKRLCGAAVDAYL